MTPVGRLAAGDLPAPAPNGVEMARGSASAIEAAVERLRSIEEGPRAFFEVVSAGSAAVPCLVALLQGASESVPQPRRLAAEALGAIGSPAAREALLAALGDCGTRPLDPVLRLAEDAVLDAVASQLANLDEHRAAAPLVALLRERPHAGCVRALGRLADRSAIPVLVACLRDDFARQPAADALRRFGADACAPLASALLSAPATMELEGSSSIQGRCAAADLLGEIGRITLPLFWALLDRERPVRIHAGLALAARGADATEAVAPALLESLGDSDWMEAEGIREALVYLGPGLIAMLDRVIRRADSVSRQVRALELLAAVASASELLPFVDHPQPFVRAAVVRALNRHPGVESARLLQNALRDSSAEVRLAALHSLSQRGALRLGWMFHLLADRDARVRRGARTILRARSRRFLQL